jgi:hypothetical protein
LLGFTDSNHSSYYFSNVSVIDGNPADVGVASLYFRKYGLVTSDSFELQNLPPVFPHVVQPGESFTFDALFHPPSVESDVGNVHIVSDDPNDGDVRVALSGKGFLDTMVVDPTTSFMGTGNEGGPFDPQCKDYTINNVGNNALDWVTTASDSWLSIEPSSGTLAKGDSTTVTVCFNEGANDLL